MLAPGGSWRQEVNVKAHNVAPWLAPWFDHLPANTQLDAHWTGQVSDSPAGASLNGLLMLDDLAAANLHAEGMVDASIGPDGVAMRPRALALLTPSKVAPRINVIGGAIGYANDVIWAQTLALQLMNGPAKLTASYNLTAGTGRLDAAWQDLTLINGVVQSGSISAALTRPFPTQLQLDASGNSTGSAPGGSFSLKCDASAVGADWMHFDWQASASTFLWQRLHPIDLPSLHLTGKVRGTTVSLDSIGRPGDSALAGWGWYDFSQRDWAVSLAGQIWPFHPAEGETFAFTVDAHGDRQRVQLHNFSLRHANNAELAATGSYVYAIPKPVSLDLHVRSFSNPAHPTLIGGALEGDVHLSGTAWPRQLDVTGQLHGTNLATGAHHLGDVALKISGTIDDERADIRTDRLALLGGEGDVDGIYSFTGDALDVGLTVRDLSLAEAGRLIGREDCFGAAGGHWHLFLPGLSLDPRRIRLTGLIQATDAGVGDLVAAHQIDAQTDLHDGTLTIKPITMLCGVAGRGSGQLSLDLANPSVLRGTAALTAWPVELPQASGKLSVDAEADNVVVELPTASAALRIWAPKVSVRASATLGGKPAGEIAIVASSAGRVADLQQMNIALLGGEADGHGHLDLDQFEQSTAEINWQKLDSAAIADFVPAVRGLSGRMSGTCVVGPASGAMALEPVAFHLHNVWGDGHYKFITLNDLTLNGYLNHTADSDRIVLADDPADQSVIKLAGGSATIWARAGVEPTGVNRRPFKSALAQVGFNGLDINQLLRTVDSTIKPTRGRLSGNFLVLGNSPPPTTAAAAMNTNNLDIFAPTTPATTTTAGKPTQRPRAAATASRGHTALTNFINCFYGEGHISITDSELANLGILTQIYNIMHFTFGAAAAKPTGHGEISVRLESGNLSVTDLRYFDRGTEVTGLATITDLADLPNSPLKGSAAGSLHPFSQINLPFISDVDTLLAIVQRSVTPMVISGTVHKPKVGPAVFGDFTSEMKNYLLSTVEQSKQ
jgi:hypothetical protein